jgi:hypothetical protein
MIDVAPDGLAGDEVANPAREACLADLTDLQAEAAQDAA